jgi:hypothetical protein
MKTVGDFINYVNSIVPNAIATTDKYVYLQDICKDIKDYNSYYDTWDTNSSTNAAFYNFPSSDINWRDVLWVGVSNSTYDVAISPSTMPYSDYTEYKYKGMDESAATQQWCEVGSSGVTFYGLSTEDKHWLRYKCIPPLVFGFASSDSTTIIKVDDMITGYIQNKLAAVVCRSGAFPRIDLGNNYEMEALEALGKLKLRKKQLETRTAKFKRSYKDWW